MKTPPSRRAFVAGISAVALRGATRTDPELILYNANILTQDTGGPRAQAVAIAGGRFLAVGSNDDIRGASKPATRQIDIGEKNDRARIHRRAFASVLRGYPAPALGRLQPPLTCRNSGCYPRAGRQHSAGRLGRRFYVRRYQDQRGPQAHSGGPRRGRAEPSGLHRTSRRPHRLCQLARLPANRDHGPDRRSPGRQV